MGSKGRRQYSRSISHMDVFTGEQSMKINQQMFLLAVEEMNFTRAAQRACVTQQCLSNHISRLEEEYRVKLFDRRPKLVLTDAGRRLYESLLQIQRIEEAVKLQLSSDYQFMTGALRFGAHTSRSQVLLPPVIRDFREMFPNVHVCISSGHSSQFRRDVMEGHLDLALTVNAKPIRHMAQESIGEERIYLIAAEELLQKRIGSWDVSRKSITVEELAMLPMTCNPNVSTLQDVVENFLMKKGIVQNIVCHVGDYQTQMELCRLRQTAFFCPEGFLLGKDLFQNRRDVSEQVRILSVEDLVETVRLDLISNSLHYHPVYFTEFSRIFHRTYMNYMAAVRKKVAAFF